MELPSPNYYFFARILLYRSEFEPIRQILGCQVNMTLFKVMDNKISFFDVLTDIWDDSEKIECNVFFLFEDAIFGN